MKTKALKAALPKTLPICSAFLVLGFSYGVFMSAKGFSFIYPLLMSLLIFAGSMEFLTVTLLLSSFSPLSAILLTLIVNMRHFFYGISLLSAYKGTKRLKPYLIFGMCDETFSINSSITLPEDIDKGWFYFFVTLLNHIYWVTGATLGGLLGGHLTLPTKGIDFILTALFVVIFLDLMEKKENRVPGLIGIVISFIASRLFNQNAFMVVSLLCICLLLLSIKPILKTEMENSNEH